MWDIASGKQLRSIIPSYSTSIMSVSYSQGVLACAFGKTIALYKCGSNEKMKLLRTVSEHDNRYYGAINVL